MAMGTERGEKEMLKSLKPIMIENSRIPVWLSKMAPINIYAIALGPWVFCRSFMSEVTKRHETIHFQQQLELLFLPFYVLYGFFWLVGYAKTRNGQDAYHFIAFEKEANAGEVSETYLENRKRYSWIKYIGNKD
jgi:hypothetical protein